MSYIFQVVETEEQPVLSVQTNTGMENLPNIIGEIYQSIVTYLLKEEEEPLGPPFIAYYNMDMENLQIKVGFPVEAELPGEGEIALRHLPGGKKAVGFHKGSYQDLAQVYDRLTEWMHSRGYEAAGVAYEHYYNTVQDVPESELLTKVEFLLK